jgi:hypothetical protein
MIETAAPTAGPTRLGALREQSPMPQVGILIGYARCSTGEDLIAQRQILR